MAQNTFTITCMKLKGFKSKYQLQIWIRPTESTERVKIKYGHISYRRNEAESWKCFVIDPMDRSRRINDELIGGYKDRCEYSVTTLECEQEVDSLENAIFRFTMQDVTNGCRPIRMECKLTNGIGKQEDIKEVEQ